ncbi:hypothetical protein B7494_g6224 [Chlorociboria aeruginascens]|nr:hypothetical protein B7494_g6224 [Chlorociboria aeruginascens]
MSSTRMLAPKVASLIGSASVKAARPMVRGSSKLPGNGAQRGFSAASRSNTPFQTMKRQQVTNILNSTRSVVSRQAVRPYSSEIAQAMVEVSKNLGMGSAAIGLSGAGVGIGMVFGALLLAVARNPSMRGQLFSYAILGFAFVEAIGLFDLMVAMMAKFLPPSAKNTQSPHPLLVHPSVSSKSPSVSWNTYRNTRRRREPSPFPSPVFNRQHQPSSPTHTRSIPPTLPLFPNDNPRQPPSYKEYVARSDPPSITHLPLDQWVDISKLAIVGHHYYEPFPQQNLENQPPTRWVNVCYDILLAVSYLPPILANGLPPAGRYGVILDAGSSGTRVYIYRWLNSARALHDADASMLHSLPKPVTKKKWTMKINPGVSTFGDHPNDVGPEHIQQLLNHALSIVPADQVTDTPIFLMATAGVRLLEPVQQKALLSEICSYTQQHSSFLLPDCDLHIQVIPGETEGLYGWIAANYLLGGFDSPEQHVHGDGHHTYGFLDMGGASAQIAFAPNSTEVEKHANDLKLLRMRTLNGDPSEYKVFTTTWLGFGVNKARDRYVEALMEASFTKDAKELLDPCLPSGLKTTLEGKVVADATDIGSNPVLMGTGLFDECLRQTYPLLDKDAPCADFPCLLHGQHVPAIDFNVNHFVGVSEYWHTTHEVFGLSHKDKAYDFTSYQRLVKDFCSEEWDDIEAGVKSGKWGEKVNAKTAQEVCFKASWLINVLHDGIGVPRVGVEKSISPGVGYNGTKEALAHANDRGFLDPFQAVDKIDGTEVSWTLGKMVIYAAGQVPPSKEDALPVGFGSNVAGIPEDFQFAGSNSSYIPIGGDEDEWADTADDLIEHAQSRSTHGFLLIILIIVIGYLFRKRERRMRLFRGVNATFRRRPGSPRKGGRTFFGASKFFGGRSSTNYERVFDGGETASEFELGEVDSDENENSDSSEGSRLGRSSGLATPKLNLVNYDNGTYLEGAPMQNVGLGLVHGGSAIPNAMNRSGLVVRTESRERLGPSLQMLGAGRRSRNGSPTRLKSPLMAPLEEV